MNPLVQIPACVGACARGGIARSALSLGTTAAPPKDNRNTQHGNSGGAQNKTEQSEQSGARNRHPNLPTDRRGIMVCWRKFCAGRGAEQERRHSRPLSQISRGSSQYISQTAPPFSAAKARGLHRLYRYLCHPCSLFFSSGIFPELCRSHSR